MPGTEPVYPLGFVKDCAAAGRYFVPRRVQRYVRGADLTERFLVDCLAGLQLQDFHKSQEHSTRPGVWLDIYRPWIGRQRMYVKITLLENGQDLLILTFCRDSEAH
jgi:hypothetical protein